MPTRRGHLPTALAAALALLAIPVAGCGGSGRTVAAYCDAFWSHAVPIHDKYEQDSRTASTNPLAVLADAFSAPGDLASILDSMTAAAPEDIRADTEALRDSFRKLQDNNAGALSNPLAALGANLGLALGSNGAFNRVNAYLTQNCPPPPGVT